MKIVLNFIGIFLLLGCSGESEICGELEGVHYIVNQYYSNMDKVRHTEYYNSEDQILRWWKPAEEIRNYKYDSEGKLIEIQHARSCKYVRTYEYPLYNQQGQRTGEYISRDPIANLDSINGTQTKIYSDTGLLKGEIVTLKGKRVQKKYSYQDGQLSSTDTYSGDEELIKSETYYYGQSNLIDSTLVFKNGITTMEIKTYDSKNRLLNKSIRSRTKIIIDDPNFDHSKVLFDNNNHIEIFEYQDDGNVVIERRIGNNGKSHLTIIREKKYAI